MNLNNLVLFFFGTHRRYFFSITVLAIGFILLLTEYFEMKMLSVVALAALVVVCVAVTEWMRNSTKDVKQ